MKRMEQITEIGRITHARRGGFQWTVKDDSGATHYHRTSNMGDGIFWEYEGAFGTETKQIFGFCDFDISDVSASTRRRRLLAFYEPRMS